VRLRRAVRVVVLGGAVWLILMTYANTFAPGDVKNVVIIIIIVVVKENHTFDNYFETCPGRMGRRRASQSSR
jgi:phospholipase C